MDRSGSGVASFPHRDPFPLRAGKFRERHFQTVWERRLFRSGGLLTEDGRAVVVDFPGLRSVEGGPDFRGARLRIGGRPVWGDVELHLTTDGWRGHRHDGDGAYDGVVLHVALRRGRSPGPRGVAELVLESALDRSLDDLAREPGAAVPSRDAGELDRLGDLRFDRRVGSFVRAVAREGRAAALHRGVFVALGYKHNRAPFEELSRIVPWGSIAGATADAIEARLGAAAAGLCWRTRGVRPANHPRRRIAQGARWLAAGAPPDPERFFGEDRGHAVRANVLLPLAVAAGTPEEAAAARDRFRALAPGPANRRLRDAAALYGLDRVETLRQEWGLYESLCATVPGPWGCVTLETRS